MAVGATVAPVTAVGAAVAPGLAVPAGAVVGAVTACGVAVAEEPQATMNTRNIEISATGFLSVESFMAQSPDIRTPGNF